MKFGLLLCAPRRLDPPLGKRSFHKGTFSSPKMERARWLEVFTSRLGNLPARVSEVDAIEVKRLQWFAAKFHTNVFMGELRSERRSWTRVPVLIPTGQEV